MQKIECTCVNTKIGTIAVKGGIKHVLVMELASADSEILIKFFNSEKTSKGNLTVSRNSDFARLYRLTTGENPSARFSRADRLLNHFVGYQFLVQHIDALDKKDTFYRKVTFICPLNPIVSEVWTATGHLIKNARSKSKNLAKNCQQFGNFVANTWQNSGNSDSAQSQIQQGLKHDLDPIQHPPYQVETSHILINKDINCIDREKCQKRPPPEIDLAGIEIDQQYLF